ncbi:hypothetical protein BDK51DRAFT_31096 [Blyttiomyces helicus]|uniref:Uncharacterized protein n=1 Tax=Blyttiomyces helicus TaxID=388810 RepID=A0A4P9WJI0_9FUNG|nr:hypothetical protein BDK51DRAFT_31096 [Blyttiomyces helicus]|eukprot:RKO92103.1 hypothetical protein BDK51DRAFT_31096 [Blyttiomyces helicus]
MADKPSEGKVPVHTVGTALGAFKSTAKTLVILDPCCTWELGETTMRPVSEVPSGRCSPILSGAFQRSDPPDSFPKYIRKIKCGCRFMDQALTFKMERGIYPTVTDDECLRSKNKSGLKFERVFLESPLPVAHHDLHQEERKLDKGQMVIDRHFQHGVLGGLMKHKWSFLHLLVGHGQLHLMTLEISGLKLCYCPDTLKEVGVLLTGIGKALNKKGLHIMVSTSFSKLYATFLLLMREYCDVESWERGQKLRDAVKGQMDIQMQNEALSWSMGRAAQGAHAMGWKRMKRDALRRVK